LTRKIVLKIITVKICCRKERLVDFFAIWARKTAAMLGD